MTMHAIYRGVLLYNFVIIGNNMSYNVMKELTMKRYAIICFIIYSLRIGKSSRSTHRRHLRKGSRFPSLTLFWTRIPLTLR